LSFDLGLQAGATRLIFQLRYSCTLKSLACLKGNWSRFPKRL